MSSCCTDAPNCQSCGRTPHPPRMSGLIVVELGLALPKFRLLPPSGGALIAAGRQVVLRRRAAQIAIDDEVAVAVGPAPRRVGGPARPDPGDDTRRRIVGAVDDVAGRGLEILAAVDLQRRLAVAEQVVGDAESRRDVVVAADAHRALERDRLRVEARRARRAVAFRRRPAPRAVVADAALQRQAADRPLVLRVKAPSSGCDRAGPSAAPGSTTPTPGTGEGCRQPDTRR